MVRDKGAGPTAAPVKRVVIHPELHRQLFKEAIDENRSLQERVHEALCRGTGRTDLLGRMPGPSAGR